MRIEWRTIKIIQGAWKIGENRIWSKQKYIRKSVKSHEKAEESIKNIGEEFEPIQADAKKIEKVTTMKHKKSKIIGGE